MTNWKPQTKTIIDKHNKDFNVSNYAARMKVLGGFDKYVSSLGLDKPAQVKTVSEFQRMVEYIMALMSIWGIDYYNGKTYWRWGQGSGTKATADAFRTSGKGKCASGDIKKILDTPTIVTTNCNYGVDTLSKALGKNIWSCDYDKMIANGAKKVTANLKPGDLVHFFKGSIKKANWRHVAIVYSVSDEGIYLADFGQRFVKSRNPYHRFPSEYSNYGNNWFAVRYLDLVDDTKKEEVVPMLNGIDIASYQTGIDFAKVPADFVIIKATEGTGYVNPDCNRAYQNAKQNGKLLGLYHYANGGDPVKEADYFINSIANYVKSAVFVLDWESGSNASFGKGDVAWCKKWLDRVYERTKVRPLIYMSQSVAISRDWTSVAKDYGLWMAQYVVQQRSGYCTAYSHAPCGAWKYPAIWQYTSGGYLPGWNGRLDLNVAYMDKEAWQKYASAEVKEEVTPVPKTIKLGSTGKVVRMWQAFLGYTGPDIDGKFGAKKTKPDTIKWQKAHKDLDGNPLKPDGVVGPKTWRSAMKSIE